MWDADADVYADQRDELEADYPAWARIRALANLSQAERERTIAGATEWAYSHCYLPCTYEMCAVLLSGDSQLVAVQITPRESFFLSPQAMVAVDPESGRAVDKLMWHSGCALRAGECELH
jgi:hypothetical protein